MAIWHDYGMRLAQILLKCVVKWMPKREYGIIAKITPTVSSPGAKLEAWHGNEWVAPITMYLPDHFEVTYRISYHSHGQAQEHNLYGVFAFDKEIIRQKMLHTGYSYLDNVLGEDIYRPPYPEEGLRWWEEGHDEI